ncbi:hypothetical protein ACFYT3_30705 [Nocardia amikacinitolerans]|uniref:hypothetical protein n=1 Tax=Nocardia amikacinitolerans TaxID=756689 RepID=UPI003687D040
MSKLLMKSFGCVQLVPNASSYSSAPSRPMLVSERTRSGTNFGGFAHGVEEIFHDYLFLGVPQQHRVGVAAVEFGAQFSCQFRGLGQGADLGAPILTGTGGYTSESRRGFRTNASGPSKSDMVGADEFWRSLGRAHQSPDSVPGRRAASIPLRCRMIQPPRMPDPSAQMR